MANKKPAGFDSAGNFRQKGQLHKPTYPYADKKEPKVEGEPLSKEIERHAPNADLKSTILAEKGLKDIAAVVAQMDPNGTGQIAPYMYPMINQIFTSMSSSSSGNESPPNPASKRITENSLTGALSILANKYSFFQVVDTFNKALENDQINKIDKEYRNIVKNALANLYKNYAEYSEGNLPYFIPIAIVEFFGPEPTPLVDVVPSLYIQQYFYPDQDPCPGYIKWVLSQDDDTEIVVYTSRKLGDPYYVSADEEIYATSEKTLAEDLDPYVRDINLTAEILNDILSSVVVVVETTKKEKTNGVDSSQNTMNLLMQLAGYAGTITNLQQQVQLPVSVLNQSSIKKTQNKFMENIGKLREMKKNGKKASTAITSAVSLGSSVLSAVSSNISSLPNSVTDIAGQVKTAENLYNIIKS